MSSQNTRDNDVVRTPITQQSVENTPGRQVSFPGEIGRAPAAHIPGQPVYRAVDGTVKAAVTTVGHAGFSPDFYSRVAPRDITAAGITAGSISVGTVTPGNYGSVVEFLPLREDAITPARGTEQSAGYDLATPEEVTFAPGERKAIPLGFAIALPESLHGRIESRSGLALKGLVVLTGVVDADYRGEVKVIMQNFSDKKHVFAAGDRVAQMVLRPTAYAAFTKVAQLSETGRGGGGFGSTGA